MVARTSTARADGGRLAWVALPLALVLAGMTGWGSLAIYFGDSATSRLQAAFAIAFAAAGVAAIGGVFTRRWRRRALTGFSLLFAAVLGWWLGIGPSNDRAWQPEVARLPYATIAGDRVTVHNVRNFTYRTESDFTPAYYSRTYNLSELDSIDLFAVYWMGPAIAHTIVSFGFGGRDYLAISIEARKEKGEGYSSIKGFFRQYELIYVVADERDVIRLRTDVRKDPPEEVYRYALRGSRENAQRFLLDYLKEINELGERPRFYNTLTANCTNVIWMHGQVNPGSIPFSWKVLASGYAPEYLYETGRLDTSIPFPELKRRGYVNAVAQALGDTPDFPRRIRSGPMN